MFYIKQMKIFWDMDDKLKGWLKCHLSLFVGVINFQKF